MLKQTLPALVLAIVFGPDLCAAQALPPETAATQMVRAAGMPLNDGALAPGMLTVRLVEGAFIRNLPDQMVEVEVVGGKVDSARTGSDGRAQFAHLPIGARVHARAMVGGERLESETFEMPAQSGVRLLLVAGSGMGSPVSASSPTFAAWTGSTSRDLPPNHPPLSDVPAPAPTAPVQTGDGVMAIRAVLLTTTIFAFGIVLFRRPRK